MKFKRSAGIILHPSSLPGPDGIGDLGPEAYRWVDFLADAGCSLWQVLPLGPTGYGDSPYQCFSAFAGNPYLVSPALLLADELLQRADLADRPDFSNEQVDYGAVIPWKVAVLDRACGRFRENASPKLKKEYAVFLKENQYWLPDFALFMALKEHFGGGAWNEWPKEIRSREPNSLTEMGRRLADLIEKHSLRQFFFFRQWKELREYAHQRGIQIIGDIPIFVANDSSDAWSHPELFFMDDQGHPTVVAGVPPDYFSPTGQLWGNPLYNWKVHKASGYSWWIERFKATLRLVDIPRLDHFRGFAGYWEVPGGAVTAEKGRWVKGPGADFFKSIQKALGDFPIIAEDLGEITPDVVALRDQFHLPGMKILQFAFADDPGNDFLPHHYPVNCVAYTGTHDNDTVKGWYESAAEHERDMARRYLARSGDDIAWDFIRAVFSSTAVFALTTMQDVLSLGAEARMNFPGRLGGNWSWRLLPEQLDASLSRRLREMNYLYSRVETENDEQP